MRLLQIASVMQTVEKMKLIIIGLIQLFPLIHGTENFHDRFLYHKIILNGISAGLNKDGFRNSAYQFMDLGQTYYGMILEKSGELTKTATDQYNVSQDCIHDIELVIKGVFHGDIWALKLLDASGKPPSGILDLDLIWPGHYDECVTISGYDNSSKTWIRGTYYQLKIHLPLKISSIFSVGNVPNTAQYMSKITYGVCFPDRCSSDDVMGFSNSVIDTLQKYLPLRLHNDSNWVQEVDHPHPAEFHSRPETIAAIVVLAVFGVFLILGTLYDLLIQQPALTEYDGISDSTPNLDNTDIQDLNATIDNTSDTARLIQMDQETFLVKLRHRIQQYGCFGKVMMSFSMYTNGCKILATELNPNQIQAVNGIRVLSLAWIMLGHTYYFTYAFSKNVTVGLDWMKRWTFQILINAFFSVDSFFLLSGMLVAFLTLKEMQRKNGRINWALFYFHRFWRLTPTLMLIMLTYIGLFQYWGDGPFWPEVSPSTKCCKKYWWRNLLYIQNFFPSSEECLGWSWYLANDMQFFLISPLILIPLYKKPLIGYIIIGMLMLEQFIFRGVISSAHDFKMSIPSAESQLFWFDNVYQRPYARISPYLVGLLTGYIFWKTDMKVKLSKKSVLIGWTMSLVCVTSVVFGTLRQSQGHYTSVHVDATYNALSKTIWSLGLAWIIFACNNGYGGIVNEFLSSPLWGPMSRLNYCAYLIHPIVIYTYVLNQRYPVFFSDINMAYMFMGNWLVSYGVSLFVSLAFEVPMIGLEKLLLRRANRG